jgi:type II secretory pathway pseudopilin PulG
MNYNYRTSRNGFTLIEIVVAVAASLMVVMIIGSLLVSGQRSWARAFNYANSKSQLDALGATIAFGKYGRQSNRTDYTLYEVADGPKFVKVDPPATPEEVVKGQAVLFHYWDKDLEAGIMDVSVTGTAYALFYLDEDKLMLDVGPVPPGAVDTFGNRLVGANVTTTVLAENVTALEFSHTTRSLDGRGKGCVRMNMTLLNPAEKVPLTVTAATLMRNVWP